MSDEPAPKFKRAKDVTSEEWEIVHYNYIKSAECLDEGVDMIVEHLEQDEDCSGPWCAPGSLIPWFDQFDEGQKTILLHQAMYRLAMLEAKIDGKLKEE